MGVFCLLLDKKKQYFQLLADIFDVAGHKLLVALDEEKAKEFLEVSSPEVLLLSFEDRDFWFKLLEKEKYLLPIFFVDNQENAERIKEYGLTELNYVLLPFNPMELLFKMVNLSRDIRQQASLSRLGFINTLLKLLNYKRDLAISLKGKEEACTLYLSGGTVKGSNCNKEKFLRLIAEEGAIIELESLMEGEYPYTYENTWDFLSKILSYKEEEVVGTISVKEVYTPIDLSQPIRLEENFYWIGSENKRSLFQKNVYLRIFEKDNISIPLLINIGGFQDYPIIRLKIEQIIGSMDIIKGLILLSSEIDEVSGIFNFLQSNYTAPIITSLSIANRLKESGVPQNRIRIIEALPERKLKLATGDVLSFVSTPFLPLAGSFMVLEENRGYLFTGRFLSSPCSIEEFNPKEEANIEDIVLYASLSIASKDTLMYNLKNLEMEKISSVYPMFGNPIISKNTLMEVIEKLTSVHVNPQKFEVKRFSEALDAVLSLLKESLEEEKFGAFVEEFNQFVYMEDGTILQSFVNMEDIPNLMINIMMSKNIASRHIKEAIRIFYRMEVPITI